MYTIVFYVSDIETYFFFIKLPSVSFAQVRNSDGVVLTANLASFKAI